MPRNQLSVRQLQDGSYKAVLATEYPVDRPFGREALEITRTAINFERFPLPVILSRKQDALPAKRAVNTRISRY